MTATELQKTINLDYLNSFNYTGWQFENKGLKEIEDSITKDNDKEFNGDEVLFNSPILFVTGFRVSANAEEKHLEDFIYPVYGYFNDTISVLEFLQKVYDIQESMSMKHHFLESTTVIGYKEHHDADLDIKINIPILEVFFGS